MSFARKTTSSLAAAQKTEPGRRKGPIGDTANFVGMIRLLASVREPRVEGFTV
jgi:hypothetical protein